VAAIPFNDFRKAERRLALNFWSFFMITVTSVVSIALQHFGLLFEATTGQVSLKTATKTSGGNRDELSPQTVPACGVLRPNCLQGQLLILYFTIHPYVR
jgi:hypothetical protein